MRTSPAGHGFRWCLTGTTAKEVRHRRRLAAQHPRHHDCCIGTLKISSRRGQGSQNSKPTVPAGNSVWKPLVVVTVSSFWCAVSVQLGADPGRRGGGDDPGPSPSKAASPDRPWSLNVLLQDCRHFWWKQELKTSQSRAEGGRRGEVETRGVCARVDMLPGCCPEKCAGQVGPTEWNRHRSAVYCMYCVLRTAYCSLQAERQWRRQTQSVDGDPVVVMTIPQVRLSGRCGAYTYGSVGLNTNGGDLIYCVLYLRCRTDK